MSWDVIFQDLPQNIKSIRDIPDDFLPGVLCSRKYYLEMMNVLFTTADFSDQSWIILENDTFSIEFSSGQEDPVESLALHVRGSEESIKEIRRLIEYTGWKALDTTSGEILDISKNMGSGLKEHNKFINQIMRSKL